MRKHVWASLIAACGLTTSMWATPADTQAFEKTIKHVDMGGEALIYQNFKGTRKLLNELIPQAIKFLAEKAPEMQIAGPISEGVLRLININAFVAQAGSSTEVVPGLYNAKAFLLLDRTQKSVFIDPAAVNAPLDWQQLPANTRVALKLNINLDHAWQMIYDEIKKFPDPTIKASVDGIFQMAMQQGNIDLNQVIASINGDIELVVIGDSVDTLACKLVIPDKNGSITAAVKNMLPAQQDGSIIIPADEFGMVHVTFQTGKITALWNQEKFAAVQDTLISRPEYKKFAELLPAEGNSYLVVDLSSQTIDKLLQNDIPAEAIAFISKFVKPFSMISVGGVTPDGMYTAAASDFSFSQLQEIVPLLATAGPAIVLPALEQARDRARQTSCFNSLKLFATAVFTYADANNGKFPANIEQLDSYLNGIDCDSIIYIGKYIKANNNNMAIYPIAFCDRYFHTSEQLHVVFADGHVEAIQVSPDAEEEDVINIICDRNNLPDSDRQALIKALNEFYE